MKILFSICSLFVLALVFSSSAISQTTNSVTQTVTFAVSRSAKPIVNTLASLQGISTSSNSSEKIALQNQLKQQSSKVTVSALNSVSSNVHLNLLSVLDKKNSIAGNTTPRIITITD